MFKLLFPKKKNVLIQTKKFNKNYEREIKEFLMEKKNTIQYQNTY